MGAFICSISPRDWPIAVTKGVYGNKYKKRNSNKPLRDVQQLSIIRDLTAMRKGDLLFFHVIDEKTVHGVYRVTKEPFFDETIIWKDKYELFPYRFTFEPHPKYSSLCEYDANIEVHSLYEIIDKGEIQSLVTLEFERNIERRSVRRIIENDAKKMVNLLLRDFRKRQQKKKIAFKPYKPPKKVVSLKNKIYRVGEIENAVKAIIMYELAEKESTFKKQISLEGKCEFANEFFVAPTTRKAIDVFAFNKEKYAIIECKTKTMKVKGLKQTLYYQDLIRQRNWFDDSKKITAVLVAKKIHSKVIEYARLLNKTKQAEIKLIKYIPQKNKKWADFINEKPKI